MTASPTLSILLAAMTAFLFGCGVVVTRRGLNYLDAQTGSMIAIGTTLLFYLLSSPFWMRAEDWFSTGFWVFVGVGVLHPMLSQFFAFEANRRIGPTLSATFCATAPFFATLSAVLILRERPGLPVIAGTVLTVIGIMVLSYNRTEGRKIMTSAILFATGAAVIRGLNHTFAKYGLERMPNPYMASFICFLVAFIGSVCMFRILKGHLPKPSRIHRKGIFLFICTGTIVGVAFWCMYGALAQGNVSIASPILSVFPMFTLIIAGVFRQEAVTRRTAAGVCMAMLGVVLIGVKAL